MSKNLIIVESPTKAKTISKFLNGNYQIKASMGHVRDLPKTSMGVDVDNDFEAKYVVDKTKQKIITELKSLVKNSDTIYFASDHDREGEAISWHLSEILKKELKDKTSYRIVFNEITKKAIEEAINTPGKIDMDKVDAQQTRRILDRIVGYKISPMLWKVIAKNLSAGRVQSVALRLICERENEVLSFVPKEYYSIEAIFSKDNYAPMKATLAKWNGEKIELEKAEDAESIVNEIKKAQAVIQHIENTSRQVEPPAPYITSSMQQDAARLLYYNAKRTMIIAQQLYEGIDISGETVGLISYMRTDSYRISEEANQACNNLIKERFGVDSLNKKLRVFKNKNTAQDAHEAIRPTDPFRTPESLKSYLSDEQMKLYTLIWQRFVATQMKPAIVNTCNVDIAVSNGIFRSSGNLIKDNGFLACYPHVSISLNEPIDTRYIEKDELITDELLSKQHFTKPPSRYTEASLIKELESLGIGRPSTYASITATIMERQYVQIIERRFSPTELGNSVNAFLVDQFDAIFNVKFTAEMEDGLDQIEYGKLQWKSLLRTYYESIKGLIDNVDLKGSKKKFEEQTDVLCNKCGNPMVIKWGKRGKFLACSNYPDCSNILNFTKDADGKVQIVENKVEELEEKCPQCGKPLLIKNSRFGKFIACSNYPTCKYTRSLQKNVTCPVCHEGEVVYRKGKKGSFYSCNRYPDCNFISKNKLVDEVCATCGHSYLEIRYSKDKKQYKYCPSCKSEYHE